MTRQTLCFALRYQDAPAAITFLGKAFGFTEHLVVPDGSGGIAHAQLLSPDGAMVMLGSVGSSAYDACVRPPQADGTSTASVYLIVDDADAHHACATAAGVTEVMPLDDKDYGGRGYSCRDLEGHVWSFGTYDPFAEAPTAG